MKKYIFFLCILNLVILRSHAQYHQHSQQPLLVIDSIVIGQYFAVDLVPEDIKSIYVLKGTAATQQYGPKGQYGVIQISTKKGRYNFIAIPEILAKWKINTIKRSVFFMNNQEIKDTSTFKANASDIDSVYVTTPVAYFSETPDNNVCIIKIIIKNRHAISNKEHTDASQHESTTIMIRGLERVDETRGAAGLTDRIILKGVTN